MKLCDIHIRDPFILPVNGVYYLYGSRGEGCWDTCSGFDVYESTDLEEWSGPVSVFEKQDGFWATHQFWAPEVHEYKGKYYMFASFKADGRCRGTQILVSDAPNKPFTPLTDAPVTPADWECLDGTLYISKAGEPYIVFCREWLQVTDGEMYALKLTDDLKQPVGQPLLLFKASYPTWAVGNKKGVFVTDGPCLYRHDNDTLYMLWSTGRNGYVQAVAVSDNGEIDGNWIHRDEFLYAQDGGHGMIFRTFEGNLKFILHTPNKNPFERPALSDITVGRDAITIK